MSVKLFARAILGTEMAAPILWAPGIFGFSAGQPSVTINFIHSFGGAGVFWVLGGGRFWLPSRTRPVKKLGIFHYF